MSYTWTDINPPYHAYYSIVYNSDATYLIAGTGTTIVVVYNNGSFTENFNSPSEVICIASDTTGQYLAAVSAPDNDIYTSTSYGTSTWTSSFSGTFRSIASDSTGQKLTTGFYGGYIYTSNDSGVTWTTNSNSSGIANWQTITSDSTGQYLAAAVDGGYIYTSTDGGLTWSTNSNSSGTANWQSITSSSNGQKLAAAVYGGYIYTSTDSGLTWSTNSNSSGIANWKSITSDSTGQYLGSAVDGGYVYTSTDSGLTWTQQTTIGIDNWQSITSDSTGQYLAVASDQGAIWTGVYNPPTPPPTPTPISDICFPIGTPITTDQGDITIEKIDPNIHTINNKKIVAVTKTISNVNYLVSFEKDCLDNNYPKKKTIISTKHKIFYRGKMIKADAFLNKIPYVKKVPYNGEILYNILMEKHQLIEVNGLMCETLNPNNIIAKLYREINLPQEYKEQFIINLNKKNAPTNNKKNFKNFIRNLII